MSFADMLRNCVAKTRASGDQKWLEAERNLIPIMTMIRTGSPQSEKDRQLVRCVFEMVACEILIRRMERDETVED